MKIKLIIISLLFGITFCIETPLAVQLDNLPSKMGHIRLFKPYGVTEEIIRNEYDFSLVPDVKISLPNHVALSYVQNTGMFVPGDKADRFKEWWCIEKLGKPLDQCNIPETWFCEDLALCDIPEEIFLHFKNDISITLTLAERNYCNDCTRIGIVKGWDPENFLDNDSDGFPDIDTDKDGTITDDEWELRPNKSASAKYMKDARVPSFYWGKYWQYLNGEPVDHRANFATNVGSPDYREFMSQVYIPEVLNNTVNADGIYFDDSKGYGKAWTEWFKETDFVEYNYRDHFLFDDKELLKLIRVNTPNDKLIIGNGWTVYQDVIDGNRRENWLNITIPLSDFLFKIEQIVSEQEMGLINIAQFSPTYDAVYVPNGNRAPVSRDRDKIYALASYYLAAGDRSYFFYEMSPYLDGNEILFIDAVDRDVGSSRDQYFIFSDQNGQGPTELYNDNFEITDSNNDPEGWYLSSPDDVEIALESECGLQGKCLKISTTSISNYRNSQQVTLKPYTEYTLAGYIKTENVSGSYLFSGANIFPYDFDDAEPLLTGCGSNLTGTNNWQSVYCTFRTGSDIEGTINIRIHHGQGTAWFDKIELREGVPRKVLARKYSKSLILVRPRADDESGYEDPVIFKMRNMYQKVFADGSMDNPSNSVLLNSGEAAILSCSHWDGSKYIAEADCLNTPPSAPVLESPSDGQIDLDSTVAFRWSHSRYPDEDTMTYSLSYCTNEDFTGCSPILISSHSDQNTYYAGRGNLSHLFILGMVFTGGIRNRKKFAFLIVAVLITGSILLSCGGGSSGSATGGVIEEGKALPETSYAVSGLNYTMSGLNPGTTYYWKVTAENGNGSTADSYIWSFRTK